MKAEAAEAGLAPELRKAVQLSKGMEKVTKIYPTPRV